MSFPIPANEARRLEAVRLSHCQNEGQIQANGLTFAAR
jgi:hypothetical protein